LSRAAKNTAPACGIGEPRRTTVKDVTKLRGKSAARRATAFALLLGCAAVLPGCVLLKQRADTNVPVSPNEQPDKILYEKSLAELKHGRYDVGRLTLQTLLNTYPDSEYLAKAKLAIADSYYRQGGIAGLTQAEAEYTDFQTFFPTAPEAPEAQFRVAMAHFRLMGKPDRDLTEARLAEVELKEFLTRYPDNALVPRVKGRLREVQEVLAQGDYEVAQLYFEHHANLAARSRFQEIADQYPNFSRADSACWYLAETLNRLRKPKEAIPYYGRIITDYPLSPLVPDAKQKLAAVHQPIPQPTKAMLARAQADQARDIHDSLYDKLVGVFSSSPNLSATRHGPVLLGPQPGEAEMAKNPASPAGGNTIAVEPVGESALKTGKAADPNASSKGNETKTESSSSGSNEPNASLPPKHKKRNKSLLKKIIRKPW
jgi:outer membrane protein assembly factor BamD